MKGSKTPGLFRTVKKLRDARAIPEDKRLKDTRAIPEDERLKDTGAIPEDKRLKDTRTTLGTVYSVCVCVRVCTG
jgi:hypothetical protein